MSQIDEVNRQLLQQRLRWLYLPVIVIFLLLAARLWQLQIIQGAGFAEQAERNRVRQVTLVAPRGTILDRNHTPLVENRPSYNILLYREFAKDLARTGSFLVEKLGIDPGDLEGILKRSRSTPLYRPLVVKEDVGMEEISVVEAHRLDHAEIQLGPQPRRLYRYGGLAAHVLGYVGEVSDGELQAAVFPEAAAGDIVGKSGAERFYNKLLTGKDGRKRVLVDSLGRETGLMDRVEAQIGGELKLTLDLNLQLTAEALLRDKVGVIVAMDPRSGEILAMASSPAFDPNRFASRLSPAEWEDLLSHPEHPLQNRAIQNAYPPGSIFKLIVAEAGLASGAVEDFTRVHCSGAASYYDHTFRCWASGGHGLVDLGTAISRSCNIFFYEIGRRIGIEKLADHAGLLGLGQRTGVDLPGEKAGVMPSPEWKRRVRGTKWYAGETISVSIGQGAVTTTPIQLLRAVSALATGGRLVTPHILLSAEGMPGGRPAWPEKQLAVAEENARKIREGMWAGVNEWGTGNKAAVSGLDVCGKTGTVQVMSAERKKELAKDVREYENHSWFVGFANRDNPEIAVVVFVEHGGGGGAVSAPLAREIFESYYFGEQRRTLLTSLVPPDREEER